MNTVDLSLDDSPPCQVTDLAVVEITEETIFIEFTAPGNNLDSDDKAAQYIFKYSSTEGNLTEDNFDQMQFNTVVLQSDLVESNLHPVVGGTVKQVKMKSSTLEKDRKYVLAMKAKDEAGNYSPVSNKAHIFI